MHGCNRGGEFYMVGEGWGILTDACKCVFTFTNTLKLMDVIVKSLEARCLQGNLPLCHTS